LRTKDFRIGLVYRAFFALFGRIFWRLSAVLTALKKAAPKFAGAPINTLDEKLSLAFSSKHSALLKLRSGKG